MGSTKINSPQSFSSYLAQVAPLAPIDNPTLNQTGKFPHLIYKNGQIRCDLTGGKARKIALEKLYSLMLEYFENYAPTHISNIDKYHLDALRGIITRQTQEYKGRHSGIWGKCVLIFRKIFRGDIDKLSADILDKITKMEKLPLCDKIQNTEVKKTQARIEFQSTETVFSRQMQAAEKNIRVIIDLCNKHKLKNESLSDEEVKVYGELHQVSLLILHEMDKALKKETDIAKSEDISKIYTTYTYARYVKLCLQATKILDRLKDLISKLTKRHKFTEDDIKDLDLYGQSPNANGFIQPANMRIINTIQACFAPPMQRVMRHALLMEALEGLTQNDATEYPFVQLGTLEAKRAAGSMNFDY